MKIIIASESELKLSAVRAALQKLCIEAEVVGVKAKSNVAAQPEGDETLLGARNRVADAQRLLGDGDVYIAIENGLFLETDGRWVDKAVVVAVSRDSSENIAFSQAVEFPKECVEEARSRGFSVTTVGQVMAEQGIISQHDDPHLSLTGISRSQILAETIEALLIDKLKWTQRSQAAAPIIKTL